MDIYHHPQFPEHDVKKVPLNYLKHFVGYRWHTHRGCGTSIPNRNFVAEEEVNRVAG